MAENAQKVAEEQERVLKEAQQRDQARFLELQAVSQQEQRQRQSEQLQRLDQQKLLGKKGSRPKLAFGFGGGKK